MDEGGPQETVFLLSKIDECPPRNRFPVIQNCRGLHYVKVLPALQMKGYGNQEMAFLISRSDDEDTKETSYLSYIIEVGGSQETVFLL
jgi:hypothetical protein